MSNINNNSISSKNSKSKNRAKSEYSAKIDVDKFISNDERYDDVMRTIEALKSKLITNQTREEEISSSNSNQNEDNKRSNETSQQIDEIDKKALSVTENKLEKNIKAKSNKSDDYKNVQKTITKTQNKKYNSIRKLKEKLSNIENDEENIIQFNKRINDILSSEKYYFNDKIFENTVTDILCRKYDLIKVNAFPFFNVVRPTKEIGFIPVINFQKIIIQYKKKEENKENKGNELKYEKEIITKRKTNEIIENNIQEQEKEKDEEILSKEFIFFNDREFFPITFKHENLDIFFLLEKNPEKYLNQITIYFNKYNCILERTINKFGKRFIFPIYNIYNSEKYLQLEKKINDYDIKINNLKDCKDFQSQKEKKEIENSKKDLEQKLKKEFDESIEIKKIEQNIKSNKSIFDKNKMLAIITIETVQKELDGFFLNKKDIVISGNGRKYDIPKDSFIVVEVKNHTKYNDILKNIIEKKRLVEKLGINIENNQLYFIGILKDLQLYKDESNGKSQEKIGPDEKNISKTENKISTENKNILILSYKDLINDDQSIYINYSEVDDVKKELKGLSKKINELDAKIDKKINELDAKIDKKINELSKNFEKILTDKIEGLLKIIKVSNNTLNP